MKVDARAGAPAMDRRDAQDDARDAQAALSRVMRHRRADGSFAKPRRRARLRPPTRRPTSRIRGMVALGVTLAALVFLATVLAWPLIVWLLSLAGINVPGLCI